MIEFHPSRITLPYHHRTAASFAIEVSKKSTCVKSNRGVVVVSSDLKTVVYGYNDPPAPFACMGCGDSCNRVAIHAEERALLKNPEAARGGDLLHVKTVKGVPVPSGPPSCWQCSRMIVEAGVARVWLLHSDWVSYTAEDFHKETLENTGLNHVLRI